MNVRLWAILLVTCFGAEPAFPNRNGMQQDPASGASIPARFVQKIKVTSVEKTVFEITAGISISANPNLRFHIRGSAECAALGRSCRY